MAKERLIVAITGASGAIYGVRALEALKRLGTIETHLIVSQSGARTLAEEMDLAVKKVERLADVVHNAKDIGASLASGSFRTLGMLVAPCSVKAMSEIATGVTTTLLTRAADVCLKERRTLVLMVRETPLHLGHLRNLTALAELGAVILPPVPAFYAAPRTLEDIVDQTVGRSLDLFGYDWPDVKRWGENIAKSKRKPKGAR